jgi:hypothetical protein
MTGIAAPLGMLAFLNLLASACCAAMPADPSVCYGGRDMPPKPPEQPAACHATLSCAEHRRLRTIP